MRKEVQSLPPVCSVVFDTSDCVGGSVWQCIGEGAWQRSGRSRLGSLEAKRSWFSLHYKEDLDLVKSFVFV
jgi:hypothetical protein